MHRIIHQMALQKIELEMQNEALLQSGEELKDSLDRYTGLYDFAPIGYLRLARDGTILEINLTGANMLGVDSLALKGDRFGRFVVAEDLPVFNMLLDRVFSRKEQRSCEVRLLNDQLPQYVPEPSASLNTGRLSVPTIRIDAAVSEDGQECLAVFFDINRQNRIEPTFCVPCQNHGFPAAGRTMF